MTLRDAIELDQNGRFQAAAAAYEDCLTAELTPEGLINLLVLYWQCTEYGFLVGHKLSKSFVEHSAVRVQQLMLDATMLSTDDVECAFWPPYIRWCDYGDEAIDEMYSYFWERREASAIPLVYFWSTNHPKITEMRPWVSLAAVECATQRTTKARYLLSLIGTTVDTSSRSE